MQITEQEIQNIFDIITNIATEGEPHTEHLNSLKGLFQKYEIFEMDEDKIIAHAIEKLDEMVSNWEKNDKDILIYTSFICTFLEELEHTGELEITDSEEDKGQA